MQGVYGDRTNPRREVCCIDVPQRCVIAPKSVCPVFSTECLFEFHSTHHESHGCQNDCQVTSVKVAFHATSVHWAGRTSPLQAVGGGVR